MTADRRLRLGGWAALLAALITPIQVVALFLASSTANPATLQPALLAETLRMAALLVAVAGLDDVFRRHDRVMADRIRRLGLLGAGTSLAINAALLAGIAASPLDLFVIPASVLLGTWFIGAGLVLLRAGGQQARIGWTALLAGLSAILAPLSAFLPLGGPVGETGHSIRDYFVLLGLLAAVYLVRIWRYVVGGRLPGPGVL